MHLLAMQNGGRRVLTADQGGQIEVGDRASSTTHRPATMTRSARCAPAKERLASVVPPARSRSLSALAANPHAQRHPRQTRDPDFVPKLRDIVAPRGGRLARRYATP